MAQTIDQEITDTQELRTLVAEEQESLDKQAGRDKELNSRAPRTNWSRWILFLASGIAVTAATLWWLYSRHYESTDDAQVDGHLDVVSTRINGTVTYVNSQVENNQFVTAGTLLLELDPRDYEAELQHATANLATATADEHSARVSIPVVDANAFGQLHAAEAAKQEALASLESEQANLAAAQHKLQQDQALHARAERDRIRYQALVEKHEISRSDYDARETEAAADAQAVEADRASIASAEQRIAERRNVVVQRQAQIEAARSAPQQVTDARAKSESASGHLQQARADLRTAQLNLSYTKIYAPVSGIIGRKTVEVGHRIQPGQGLLVIVPVDDIWITANFKEAQLRRMRPAQPVTIHVDTFGRDYEGYVENLPGAAGPLFSLFPPENATGNYVKVVQRFPVRIRLKKDQDPERRLRPGMSVEPTVKVG